MNREDRRAYDERAKARAKDNANMGWSKDSVNDKKFIGRVASRCIPLSCRCKMCKQAWVDKAETKNKKLPDSYYQE